MATKYRVVTPDSTQKTIVISRVPFLKVQKNFKITNPQFPNIYHIIMIMGGILSIKVNLSFSIKIIPYKLFTVRI